MPSSREITTMEEAARVAGEILKNYFETPLVGEQKIDKSFVTKADGEAELAIRNILEQNFPGFGVLGEECGSIAGECEECWIIDPLDGTANFMNAIPIFCVSIALMKKGTITHGVIYHPLTDTMFTGERGEGAWVNGAPMHVSNDTKKNVVITFGKSSQKEDGDRVNTLFVAFQQKRFRVRYLGSAALELAYLARGGIDGYINMGTNLWDYAAGALLVEEAGGKLTCFDGTKWENTERHFVASNNHIHESLLESTEGMYSLSI